MKNKILLLIVASIIALLALSAIQGYLIYNSYQLKKDAFISETSKAIIEIDNHPTLDSIYDIWEEDLGDHISDYLNKRINKIQLNSRFLQKANEINSLYNNVYRSELDSINLSYNLEYAKRLNSLVLIQQGQNDTIFPNIEKQAIILFGNQLDMAQSNKINSHRIFSEIDYVAEIEGEFITKSYEIELRSDDQIQISDWQSIIFKRMAVLLISSVLIFLFVIGILYYSIKKWISQKKINEIKTDFINNITHELKTPLATLSIASKSLQNEKIKNNPLALENTLKIVNRQNDRLQKLIDQVMNNSLSSNEIILSKEIISDNEYFQDLLSDFKLSTQHGKIEIDNQIIPEEVFLRIDKFHFSTALLNILENAVKYGKEQVFIQIKTILENGNYVIKIKDNGIGIASEKKDQIFEKFYRASDGDVHNVKGLGLGLYYTKQIVMAHSGQITVDSKLNKGSTFSIKIPLKA